MKCVKNQVNVLEECYAGGRLFRHLYHGELKKNKPHGFGVQYYYPDIYIGNFSFGKKNDYGIYRCERGYKQNGKCNFTFMEKGIYFGIFKKNKFFKGKVIEFNRKKGEKNVYFIDNYMLNGPYKIYHPEYEFTFHYKNDELIGDYIYHGKYTVYAKLNYGEFHGTSIIMTKDGCHHQLFYDNGIVKGKSLYLLPNGTYFVLRWLNNICQEIVFMKDRNNKLYYPQRILENVKVEVPLEYQCPIGYTLMIQPYINKFQQTYEFNNLQLWIKASKIGEDCIRDPLTNKICEMDNYKPNLHLQYKIYQFLEKTLISKEIFYLK